MTERNGLTLVRESIVDAVVELLAIRFGKWPLAPVSSLLVDRRIIVAVDDSITIAVLSEFLHVALN